MDLLKKIKNLREECLWKMDSTIRNHYQIIVYMSEETFNQIKKDFDDLLYLSGDGIGKGKEGFKIDCCPIVINNDLPLNITIVNFEHKSMIILN